MKSLLFICIVLWTFSLHSQNILISEDFEANNLPNGWTISTNASDGGWSIGTAQNIESQWWEIANHGKIIGTNDDDCDCDKSMDYLILPTLDFSNITAAALQFENYFDGGEFQGNTEIATLEYSLDNGASWSILSTIEGAEEGVWDSQSIDLSSLCGNANVLLGFHYDDDGGWMFGWAIDDVLIFEPEGLDLALTSLAIPPNVNVPATLAISGTVTNMGAETITSFDVSWDIEGGMIFNTSVTGVAIPSLGTYNFTHPDNLQIFNSGQTSLQVTLSNINGLPSDDNSTNDVLSMNIQALEYGTII
ncbi:MAG: choice-of-anchor J domain-containing protein, partial [Crocinitomicaceae bacterium]|nr:choice-of-anchor J domain-containing protein [Crocinitomicaceae bacterium]